MTPRIYARQLPALFLMAGLLLVPLAASADSHEQEAKPLTWASYAKAKTGQRMAACQYIAKSGTAIYDGLMKDGHVVAWGVGMPVNHRAGDDWDVLEWVTFRDWAAMDAFLQAFMAMESAKSPKEKEAEEKEWRSLVEPGSHYDTIVRHQALAAVEGKPPAFLDLSYWRIKPGQGDTLTKLWEDSARPVLKKLQDAGTIGSSGLATTEIHDGSGSTAMFWTALPNLAAREAVDAAYEAAEKERDERIQKAMMETFFGAVDFEGHHDRIIMVIHNGGTEEGDGEK